MKKADKHKTKIDKETEGSVSKPEQEQITISKTEYEGLKNKEREIDDKMLRFQADIDNIKRRLDREKTEFIKFSNTQIIAELIPFVDDFKRAFATTDSTKEFNVLHKGVEMILKHLLDLLKKKGVVAMEPLGKPFDPLYHEAIMQIESDEHPENTVIEEFEQGYLLNDRVLRTAKVKVSKTKEELIEEEAAEQENS